MDDDDDDDEEEEMIMEHWPLARQCSTWERFSFQEKCHKTENSMESYIGQMIAAVAAELTWRTQTTSIGHLMMTMMIMMMRWMMMEVGKIFRRRAEPASSGTLNLPPTRFHRTAMMKMIQMMKVVVIMMVMVVMRKVGGDLRKGGAASSGNTTPRLSLNLHS